MNSQTPPTKSNKLLENYFKRVRKLAEKEIQSHNACGCTMTVPHTHLVAGHTCECERGIKTI